MENLNNAVAALDGLADSFCSGLVRKISVGSVVGFHNLIPHAGSRLDVALSTGMDFDQGKLPVCWTL